MAKFVSVPKEETSGGSSAGAEAWFIQDATLHQALAVMGLAAVVTVFVVLLLRSLIMGDRKPRGKPAALTGEDYSGQGISGKARGEKTQRSIRRQ